LNKGFSYKIDIEDIKRYMKVPVAEKLEWLEEMFRLTKATDTAKQKKVREHFRGENRD